MVSGDSRIWFHLGMKTVLEKYESRQSGGVSQEPEYDGEDEDDIPLAEAKKTPRAVGQPKVLCRSKIRHAYLMDFVSGSKCWDPSKFFCRICKYDVSLATKGHSEIGRLFGSKSHWAADARWRYNETGAYYDKVGEHVSRPTEEQIARILTADLVELGEIYPFPEEVIQERMENQVALMTVVSCICDVMKYGGSYDTIRYLWGHFRSTLGEDHPQHAISWNLPFTVVSIIRVVLFVSVV